MLRRFLSIFVRIIVGIFLFYTIAGFVLLPLALTWAIPTQGTQILKHPVHLHSVGFNPFLLKLIMSDLEVLDVQNQVMVGVDRLSVDVSFIDLFKKIYHVRDLRLDGLKINAALLPGNHLNLLDLIPPQHTAPATSKSGPLPVVIIDHINVHQGRVHFIDKTIKPNFSTSLSAIELAVTHVTTNPKDQTRIDVHANLDDKGKISMHVLIRPLAQPMEMETSFSLNNYALTVLTPYAGKYTGREFKNGLLDLKLDYRIGDNKLTASHELLIQQFAFGNSVESHDALHLPFGLAVALLEDPQGRIKITLPASGDMKDPKFEYSRLISQVIRNFFINLVTKPFSFLASTLGASDTGVDELGYVRFEPGKADLSYDQRKKLMRLIKSLREHPKLRLEINGSYDSKSDWKSIQASVFIRDYDQLRKISTRSEGKVYQLLYQRHFGIRSLWALARKYKKGIGIYNDDKLDLEIKRQLIENGPPDEHSLNILAQSRAQLVHDFFLTGGFDSRRLSIGHPQATQSSLGYVPLEFTLTVFGKT